MTGPSSTFDRKPSREEIKTFGDPSKLPDAGGGDTKTKELVAAVAKGGGGGRAAADELGVSVPLVVRLQGTNAPEGRTILAESGLDITPAETLAEAGQTVVAAARAAG